MDIFSISPSKTGFNFPVINKEDFASKHGEVMREKIKYQLTNKRFCVIEVSNPFEKKVIRVLNNEFDKTKKRNRTYYKHNISLEAFVEKAKKEPESHISEEDVILEKIQKEEILNAINKLTYLQKQTIIQYFYLEKSLRQIARERGVNEKTVRECYHSAIKKLGFLLKNIFFD